MGGNQEKIGWWIVFPVVAGFAATSTESFWIDEAHTAFKAIQPTWMSWWEMLVAFKGSDLQMPFFMFYIWIWEKCVGHSEWALRCGNLPWFLLGNCALIRAFPSLNARRALVLFFCGSPFVWVYLNEVRPYIMQLAGSSLAVAGLLQLDRFPNPRGHFFLQVVAGCLLLSGSSALGMIWAGVALGGALLITWKKKALSPVILSATLGTGMVLTVLLLFYLWTLKQGAGATLGQKPSLLNLAFACYELLGFSGLGPSRLDLREQGLEAIKGYWLPLASGISVLGTATVLALIAVARTAGRQIRWLFIAYLLVPTVALFCLGELTGFRLLGRHLTPCFPVILWMLVKAVDAFQGHGRLLWTAVGCIWIESALFLRFAPEHRKDDYRYAAQAAREVLAKGGAVWWNADPVGAVFYGVPLRLAVGTHPYGRALPVASPGTPAVDWIHNPNSDLMVSKPDLVIRSRQDLYDTAKLFPAWVAANGYLCKERVPAFELLVPDRAP
jgi:hypothetical protein